MRIGSRSTSNCQRLANVPGVPGGDGSIPPWMRPTTSSSGRSLPRSRATPIGPGHALWYCSWQTLWLQAKHPSAGTRRSAEPSVASTSGTTTVRTGGQARPGRGAWLPWGAHRLERSEIAQVIERNVSRSTLAARVSVATPLTLRVSSVEYRGSTWRVVMLARCAASRVPTTKRVHRA